MIYARPECADCGSRVSARTATVYVDKDGENARILCQNCQHHYPRERQYSPTELPRASRPHIRDVDPSERRP